MYSAWFVRAVIGSPASYAVLKTVVETWQTPPPRAVWSSPLMITVAWDASVPRRPVDGSEEVREVRVRGMPTELGLAVPVLLEQQHRGELPARDLPARWSELDGDRRRQHALVESLRRCQVGNGDMRLLKAHGQGDGRSLEACERAHDDPRGGAPIEHRPCLAVDELDPQALPHEPCVASRSVDRLPEQAQLVRHRGLVGVRSGRDPGR